MEQEKVLRLLLRQLKDIQAQADKIVTGENSAEAIETFSRYSSDLKTFIAKNIDSEKVTSYLTELPEINYSRSAIHLWQFLILPAWWVAWYNNYKAKQKAIEEINTVRGKYATLELLVKGFTN